MSADGTSGSEGSGSHRWQDAGVESDLPCGYEGRQLYVVRTWFEKDGDGRVWRATVHCNRDARRSFATLPALLHFLTDVLKPSTAHDADSDPAA